MSAEAKPTVVDAARCDRAESRRAGVAAGPVVVGGTGGSGTRVVARILMSVGVNMGAQRNAEEDALALANFDWRFGPTLLALELQGQGADFGRWDGVLPDGAAAAFLQALRDHGANGHRPWGWKHPHAYLLLPFLRCMLPAARFVHVVRDGRDVALSANQRQLHHYGALVLGRDGSTALPVRSAAFWSRANALAADFGEAHMPADYLRVRLEDLCTNPVASVRTIARFLGLDALTQTHAAAIGQTVVTMPTSLGRWRSAPDTLRMTVQRAAMDALIRFGYLSPADAGHDADRYPRPLTSRASGSEIVGTRAGA